MPEHPSVGHQADYENEGNEMVARNNGHRGILQELVMKLANFFVKAFKHHGSECNTVVSVAE